MINEGFVVLCDFLLCFCSLILPIQLYYNFWIYVFDIYIIISNQLFAAKRSSVLFLMDFLFFFLKLILDLFLHLLYFLCGYCSAMLINVWIPLPEKQKGLICIVCICLYCIWFFISNYQCEVTEQVVGKRCALLVLLYHWAVTNVLIPANGPHWDFKIKFSSSSVIFLKQFCLIKGLTGSGSFELWMFQ